MEQQEIPKVEFSTFDNCKLPEIEVLSQLYIYDCNNPNDLPALKAFSIELSESEIKTEQWQLYLALMCNTMYQNSGIGLAAPQIGLNNRVIVVDTHWASANTPLRSPYVIINPTIEQIGEETQESEEACLSVPGLSATITRPAEVVVRGKNPEFKDIEVTATGLQACCFAHEIDHLNGVLLYDNLSRLKKDMYNRKIAKLKRHAKKIAKYQLTEDK